LIGLIENKGVPIVCCDEKMTELLPNTVETSVEKHLSVVSDLGNKIEIEIGTIPHPMEEAHYVDIVYVETECGGQRKCLRVGQTSKAVFCFEEDKPIAV